MFSLTALLQYRTFSKEFHIFFQVCKQVKNQVYPLSEQDYLNLIVNELKTIQIKSPPNHFNPILTQLLMG